MVNVTRVWSEFPLLLRTASVCMWRQCAPPVPSVYASSSSDRRAPACSWLSTVAELTSLADTRTQWLVQLPQHTVTRWSCSCYQDFYPHPPYNHALSCKIIGCLFSIGCEKCNKHLNSRKPKQEKGKDLKCGDKTTLVIHSLKGKEVQNFWDFQRQIKCL